MEEITKFVFNGNKVRTMTNGYEILFVAKDVCDILAVKNSRHAMSRLDNDEKGVAFIDTLGGEQKMTVVNEFGLYSLIMSSRKKEAKELKRWVTHEVLPTIRKTGGAYIAPNSSAEAQMSEDPIAFAERVLALAKIERAKRIDAEESLMFAEQENKVVVMANHKNKVFCGRLQDDVNEITRTKAEIGSRREATAMATASSAVKARNKSERESQEREDSHRAASVSTIENQSQAICSKIGAIAQIFANDGLGQEAFPAMHHVYRDFCGVSNLTYGPYKVDFHNILFNASDSQVKLLNETSLEWFRQKNLKKFRIFISEKLQEYINN